MDGIDVSGTDGTAVGLFANPEALGGMGGAAGMKGDEALGRVAGIEGGVGEGEGDGVLLDTVDSLRSETEDCSLGDGSRADGVRDRTDLASSGGVGDWTRIIGGRPPSLLRCPDLSPSRSLRPCPRWSG
jgi:hypothetical protein